MPWGLIGETLILDTHTHTRFSDGALSVMDVVNNAVASGCNALAITDHTDSSLPATPEYFEAIDSARAKFPGLILFAGLEWNIPPYGGREHVTVLIDPAQERNLLPFFKTHFDGKGATAGAALQWLQSQVKNVGDVVLAYNHPSRADTDENENVSDVMSWRSGQRLFVGFEGAPGHQKLPSPGGYRNFMTNARWDPAVAAIGGAWDRLLDTGMDFWGALAVSDYHNENMDLAPCSFARTHVRVPQRNHAGVLAALRAGSFWGDHGRMLDDLAFIAAVPDLSIVASPGEAIAVSTSAPVTFRVQVRRGAATRDQPLTVELIGNIRSGVPERLASGQINAEQDTFDWKPSTLVPGQDGKTAYVRARVFGKDAAGQPLGAYANPIRLVLRR